MSFSYQTLFQINLHLKSHSQTNKAKTVLTVTAIAASLTAGSCLAYVQYWVVRARGQRTRLRVVCKMPENLDHYKKYL